MADLVREWKRAVHDPEVARLNASIAAMQDRVAKLEAALRDIRSRTIDDVARDIAHKALGEK